MFEQEEIRLEGDAIYWQRLTWIRIIVLQTVMGILVWMYFKAHFIRKARSFFNNGMKPKLWDVQAGALLPELSEN